MKKPTWYCTTCGKQSVYHDAHAEYDPVTEDYVVIGVLDGSYCDNCDEAGDVVFAIPPEPEDDR